MGTGRRLFTKGMAGLGVGVVALTGCQTYPAGFGGMTLPSPHYLKHQPQYFPPDPAFPLQRELNSMQADGLDRPGLGGPLAAPAPGPIGQGQAPLPTQIQPPAPVGGAAQPPQGGLPAGGATPAPGGGR